MTRFVAGEMAKGKNLRIANTWRAVGLVGGMAIAVASGIEDGCALPWNEKIAGMSVDAMKNRLLHRLTFSSNMSAFTPGTVTNADLGRIFKYIEDLWSGRLVDLQSKTLDAGFISEASDLAERASRENMSKTDFLDEMQRLADDYGESGYQSNYGATWHRTVVLHAPYTKGVDLVYGAEPTKRLYPYATIRDYGGPVGYGKGKVRPTHRALDGFVARIDWPHWDHYTPPFDWNCRCRKIPIRADIARAAGYTGDTPRGTSFLEPVDGQLPGRKADFAPMVRIFDALR